MTLKDARSCEGTVVVIDVLRAFTLGALALAAGAREIWCVATVEQALDLRAAHAGSLAMGEQNRGKRVPEFDFGNSPSELAEEMVNGRLLIHRTSAGTQGLVAASAGAAELFAASFVCAGATARAVRALKPDAVTFVTTGVDDRDGDEDVACAEYLERLLTEDDVVAGPYLDRVGLSDAARAFLSGDPNFPVTDLQHATHLDAVPFAMRADLAAGPPKLRRHTST